MADKSILFSFLGTICLLVLVLYLLNATSAVSVEELLSFEMILTRFISAVAAVFTFFLAWVQLGNIKRSLVQQRLSSVRQELNSRDSFSINLLSNERKNIYERQIKLDSTYSEIRQIPETEFHWNIRQVDPQKLLGTPEFKYAAQEDLAFWEHLACAVNSGAANYFLIDKMYGGAAQNAYTAYSRYIRFRKRGKNGNRFYDQYDRFVDEMHMNKLCMFKITQGTLDKCNERYLDKEILKKLKALKSIESKNYHEFSNLLAKHQLHSHELLIYEFTHRKPRIRLEYVKSIDSIIDELTELYTHLKKATGFYPPSDDLRAWAKTANADIHIIARDNKTNKLVGHVSVTNCARAEIIDVIDELSLNSLERLGFDYLNGKSKEYLENSFSEINKLSRWQSTEYQGLGKLLYRTSVRYCNEVLQKKVAFSAIAHDENLVVSPAIKLYFSEGAEVIGDYVSPTGLTLKIFVS